MKAYGGVNIYIHIFLTSVLVGGEWSDSCPGCFTPGERVPGTHWIRGWVDPRTGLDDVEEILTAIGTRTPTRSQSLYRLRYPGSFSACHHSTIAHPTQVTEVYDSPDQAAHYHFLNL
jgi:hypothetical protein